jgi:NADPH:quinone reductase
MKAVQFAHFGERDVLEYIDVATPKPKNDDLLIEVTAAGVNFVDIRERMGVYGRPETHVGHIDLPHISGLQAVGTVMEVGPSGDRSRIGAKVMSYLLLVVATRNSPWHLPSFRSSSLLQSMKQQWPRSRRRGLRPT